MRIHYLQHVSFENPGNIIEWAHKKGYKLTGTHLYNFEAVPAMEQFDWLIVMGGPMNIYEDEKYEWLEYEKKFIKEAIDNHKIVIGICLGAQLITDTLGGKVTKNPEKEIGFFPINFDDKALKSTLFNGFPKGINVFHWHGDTFSEIGEGCEIIASSNACKNQGFIYNEHVIGFQFHMECKEKNVLSLIENCGNEITSDRYIQTEEEIKDNLDYLKIANTLMYTFLDNLEAYYLEGSN